MPTSGRAPDVLVDTSVAVALSIADHEHHADVLRALDGRRLGLAGHAAFETFSVLTRLPPPARRTPAVVARVMRENFPATRFLSPDAAASLLERLAAGEIAGGAVYDALVGAVALEHGSPLVTVDRRALDTYRVLGVDVEVAATGGRTEPS
ncbi:MAG: type II toxin-antitoxin system VapC family toxin [Acidimicrobiia bacterium]|nr:type II toxin-antitoxin system VapC family toxin [Acidimicrobiia bacterium]